ncbi:MAG: NAD(P)/FAD-dependent oxidoreductase [Candidatus Pacebacteria bacterium]|nr:NAD(P)/FAD-dependent oxidoreductase [Candidatus Paceibacterota bacterium]
MKYNTVVIGGGAAGMMAACRSAELGARVVLIEKHRKLGTKLLITGKGRCNITNKVENNREFVSEFGKNGKFIFSALYKFGIDDTINFFNNHGVNTKVERGNRVFPKSDKSIDVLNALIGNMKNYEVEIRKNSQVKDFIIKDNNIQRIILKSGEKIEGNNYILCTGGKSCPTTGSSGDGYDWLSKLGHTVIELFPSLTPIIVKDKVVKELEGLSLKNVKITAYKGNKVIDSKFGEAIFTSDGMSGPIILDLSRKLAKLSPKEIKIKIDFKPALDQQKLDKRIQRDFMEGNNKMFKNSLDKLLPQKLIPVIIKLSEIDADKKVNLITHKERMKLLNFIKEFTLELKELSDYNKAIITSGGVKLNEIDPKTMKSKLIDNLYLAGEILDLDGPTGGYNLQVCWSTGYVAGDSAGKNF